MATVSVDFIGDSSKLTSAQEKAAQGQDSLTEKLTRMTGAANRAAQSNRELERAAKAVYESTRTPMEQYEQRMTRLNRLHTDGRISTETLARATQQAREAFERAGQAGEKAFGTASIARLTEFATGLVSIGTAVGLATKALTDFDERKNQLAAKQGEASRGMGSLAQLTTDQAEYRDYVHLAKEIHAKGGAESEDAAARAVFGVISAGGTKDEARFLGDLAAAKLITQPDVMATGARTIMTAMGEEETGNMRAVVSKVLAAASVAPGDAAEIAAGAAKAALVGKRQKLTDEEILAGTAIAASATGTAELGGTALAAFLNDIGDVKDRDKLIEKYVGGKAPQRPKVLPEPAAPQQRLGEKESAFRRRVALYNDETLPQFHARQAAREEEYQQKLAEYQVKRAEAEAKADRFGQLKGKTLAEKVAEIKARGYGPSELSEFLGDERARRGYSILEGNIPQLQELTKKIQEAQATDRVGLQMALPNTVSENRAANERQKAKARLELASWQEGVERNISDTILDVLKLQDQEAGRSAWATWTEQRAFRLGRFVSGSDREMNAGVLQSDAIKPERRREVWKTYEAMYSDKIAEVTADAKLDEGLRREQLALLRDIRDNIRRTAEQLDKRRSPTLRGPEGNK